MKNIKNKDQQHLQLLEDVEFQPVFILGLHRSGTSILYKMLTAIGCFNPVTAYHLIDYNKLIDNHVNHSEEIAKRELTESFRQHGLEDRVIDKLKINADFAEEYGFLLGQQTSEMYITPKNLPLFKEMCKKIRFIAENSNPVLLKNPYDFSNFIYIKKIFPNAKFVFIHRHPLKTLSSTIKALDVLLKDKNPYTTRLYRLYNKIFENPLALFMVRFCFSRLSEIGVMFLTLNSSKGIRYYLKNINKLPKKDYVSIKYEDFCKDPQKNMEKILLSLEIKTNSKIDFTDFIKTRETQLDPGVMRLRRFICVFMKKYFKQFGYSLENVF